MRMKKFKSIAALFLAIAMVLPLVGPFAETASATSAENDLTGWTQGATTTMSGTPEDGWQIDFSGSRSTANITSYEAKFAISGLRVQFNLNDLPVGKAIMLQFADESERMTGVSSGAATRINFFLERHSDKLRMYGYNSGAFSTRDITSFDFTKDHVIEFVKTSSDAWDLAIDGTAYSVSNVDAFVDNMLTSSPNKTYINFIPHDSGDTVLTVKNIKFTDLKGWTAGATTTLSGNGDSGWKLAFSGARNTTNLTSYQADTVVSALQFHFNLNDMPVGKAIMLQFSDESERTTGVSSGAETRINFFVERHSDKLRIYGYNSGAFSTRDIATFDFAADHVFGFVNNDGQWDLELDGQALSIDGIDTFVTNMLTKSPNKTYINFIPHESGETVLTIKNIRFSKKAIVSEDDLTGWTQGATTTLTGKPESGWKLMFSGARNTTNLTSYEANVAVSRLQVHFNLNDMPVGKAIMLQFSDESERTTGVSSGAETRINFFIERHSDKLRIYGYNSGAFSTRDITSFDFTKDHVIEFVDTGSGAWDLAIDGTAYSVSNVDTFVENMLTKSPNKTYVNFIPHESGETVLTINNIRFSEKAAPSTDDLTGWIQGATTQLSGTPEKGWQINLSGDAVADNYNSYQADIDVSKLQVQFNLSEMTAGNFILHFVNEGDRTKDAYLGTATKMNFVFEYRDGGKLAVYGYDSRNPVHEHPLLFFNQGKTFDYNANHSFGFIKNGDDKYVPALDGVALTSDTNEVTYFDDFVNKMLSESAGKTFVSFCPNDSDVTIKNVNFVEKSIINDGTINGWTVGVDAAVSENTESGYKIEFKGARFANRGTSYKTAIDISRLQVSFNLDDLAVGKSIVLQLANERGSFDSASDTRINIMLQKTSENKLVLYGYDSRKLVGDNGLMHYQTIEFDYSKDHVLDFEKNNDMWVPQLDGKALTTNNDLMAFYDNFVKNMMRDSAGSTVVNFAPNDGEVATDILIVKNIRFIEKSEDITQNYWVKNNGVTVSGDETNGYSVQGSEYLRAYYRTKFNPAKTTLHFQFSVKDKNWNSLAIAGNMDMPTLPSAEQMEEYNGMVFILERRDTTFYLQVWEGKQISNLKIYKEFDFDKVHTLTFVNEHGNWYVAFDGEVIRSRQMNDMVEPLLAAEDGVNYRFTACYNDFSFTNIKFENTPKDTSATSKWNVVGYEMSGSGNALKFTGNGYASWEDKVNIKDNSIELQFKPANNGWAGFTICEEIQVKGTITPRLVVPEEGNALTIILGRQGETDLRISLFGTVNGSKAEKLIFVIKKFDFNVAHEFRFVEKNGSYYLAVDGDIIARPSHDGEEKYITNAIANLIKKTDGNVYFNFFNDQTTGVEWKKINFVEEEFIAPDIFKNGYVDVKETSKGLSVSGSGIVGINSLYNVGKDKVRVQFKPENGNWVMLTVGNTASATVGMFQGLDNEYNMMSFVLGRQNDNQLRISLFDGKQELLMMVLYYFDFDAAHTFSFVQHRGKYYLAIDDRMIEAVVHDGDDEVVTTWITKAVKRLNKEGAYIRFCSMDGYNVELSQIKFNGSNQFRSMSRSMSPTTGDNTWFMPTVCALVVSTGVIVGTVAYNYKRRKVGSLYEKK